MNANLPDGFQVTLDNCDREPIHIPGRIQSHGVLVALGLDRRVSHVSANAPELLGALAPRLGEDFYEIGLGAQLEVAGALEECLRADGIDVHPVTLELELAGRSMELVAHRLGGRVILEFETRAAMAGAQDDHAFRGHRALVRLRRQRQLDELLQAAAEEVRAMTGFDRVMAYRFRDDDSGEVVAEARVDTLEPFLGQRYPASDIPAQARRLYILNTLRNIADIGSTTVPVEAADGGAEPLDLSFSVLRGVSPVHIEYLTNMGVAASMSISIVVHGQLWGMLACHHMSPYVVPYSVRTACDVLAHVLAANVQGILAHLYAERMQAATLVRTQATEVVLHADDGVFALSALAPQLCTIFDAEAVVLGGNGRVFVHGGVSAAAGRALLAWLGEQAQVSGEGARLMHQPKLDGLPDAAREALGSWCGYLAMRYDRGADQWLVLLRREQIETIKWGGRPEKEYVHGPMGWRLTPRGSFEVWKQTVRGSSAAWGAADLEIAQSLLSELVRVSATRGADLDHARGHLLGLLSDSVGDAREASAAEAPAPGRMQRLVGQVLDAARLQSGAGLQLRTESLDLSKWLGKLLDELAVQRPDTRFIREIPPGITVTADPTRLRQLVGGLLTNAWQHGVPDEPVIVQLARYDGAVHIDVSNTGEAIGDEEAAAMFDPLRPGASRANGLGLGLYIGRNIARAHGGELSYVWADPYVLFSVTLPDGQG